MAAHNRKKGNPKQKLRRKQVQAELALPTPAAEVLAEPSLTAGTASKVYVIGAGPKARLDDGLWFHPMDEGVAEAPSEVNFALLAVFVALFFVLLASVLPTMVRLAPWLH